MSWNLIAGIEETLVICAAFTVADRLADTFDYAPPDAEGARRGGEYLLQQGYRQQNGRRRRQHPYV